MHTRSSSQDNQNDMPLLFFSCIMYPAALSFLFHFCKQLNAIAPFLWYVSMEQQVLTKNLRVARSIHDILKTSEGSIHVRQGCFLIVARESLPALTAKKT